MFATMIILGVLAAAALATGLVQFRRDGYHRMPTLRF
jgi:hypothetical protein